MTILLKNATLYADPSGKVLSMTLQFPGAPFPFEDQDGLRYTITGRLPGQDEPLPLREWVRAIVLLPLDADLPSAPIEHHVYCDEALRDSETGNIVFGKTMSIAGELSLVKNYLRSIALDQGVWSCTNPMIGDWQFLPVAE